MLQPLDGPSAQFSASLTSVTVVEIKAGASVLSERKVITLQPLDGDVWVYFGDGITTPNAATVASDGFRHYSKDKESYEATNQQQVFMVAVTGTVDVRGAERA